MGDERLRRGKIFWQHSHCPEGVKLESPGRRPGNAENTVAVALKGNAVKDFLPGKPRFR